MFYFIFKPEQSCLLKERTKHIQRLPHLTQSFGGGVKIRYCFLKLGTLTDPVQIPVFSPYIW